MEKKAPKAVPVAKEATAVVAAPAAEPAPAQAQPESASKVYLPEMDGDFNITI